MALFNGLRQARVHLTEHGDDIHSILPVLNGHLDNSIGWVNSDNFREEVDRSATNQVGHQTSIIGNYLVSNLSTPGNRYTDHNTRKAAAAFSSTPNQIAQGYVDGDTAHYLVMTRLSSTGSAAQQPKEAAAVHALNTYIIASSLRSSLISSELATAKLRDKYQYGALRNGGLPIEDRGLLYYAQYTGSIDFQGANTQGGEEFWIVRNEPHRMAARALQRRWSDGVNILRQTYGLPGSSTRILQEYGERVRASATNMYQHVLNYDGTVAQLPNAEGNLEPVQLRSVMRAFQGSVQDPATVQHLLNSFYADRLQPVQMVEDARSGLISGYGHSDVAPPPRPYDRSAQTTLDAIQGAAPRPTPAAAARAEAPPRPTPRTDPVSDPGARWGERESLRGTAPSPESTPPPPSFSAFGFDFSRNWGDRSNYLQSNTAVESSREASPVAVDQSFLRIISPEEFKGLETRYAIGGIEHAENSPIVQATPRSVEALQKLRELLGAHQVRSDADQAFYRNVGNNALPSNTFEVRKIPSGEYHSIDRYLKKRMELAGAFVGTDDDGFDVWLLDHPGEMNLHVSSILSDRSSASFQRNRFNISDSPTPAIEMNPDRWQIMNMDMTAREASGHGFVIPIKENQAIFVPAFANPDFTFGIEFETGIHRPVDDILRGVQQNFGYDLTKFGFHDRFNSVSDPSIYGGGREYLTPVMSGIRAYKAAYLFGEGLQMAGATQTPTHSLSSGRNDPSGIHINIGSIPQENRKNGIKFMADYLRLVEDVYKKITTNDLRYRYYAKPGYGFPYTDGSQSGAIVPTTLSPESLAAPPSEHARQFWAQSMSNVRKAGSNRVSEYEYYRQHGSHYTPITSISNLGYGLEKLSKYKTVAVHKLLLKGIMEFRSPIYRPGGAFIVNQMSLASKMAGDLYLGAMGHGEFALTDKLVPPSRRWGPDDDDVLKKIAKNVFGIEDATGQDFIVKLHKQCAAD